MEDFMKWMNEGLIYLVVIIVIVIVLTLWYTGYAFDKKEGNENYRRKDLIAAKIKQHKAMVVGDRPYQG